MVVPSPESQVASQKRAIYPVYAMLESWQNVQRAWVVTVLLLCLGLFSAASEANASFPLPDSTCAFLCASPTGKAFTKSALVSEVLPLMKSFYQEEKLSGLGWGGVGLVSAGVGTGFFFAQSQFLQGMAYPLVIIGGIQIIYGIFLLAASDGRIAKFSKEINQDPYAYVERTTKQLKRQVFLFTLIGWFELLVSTAGIGMVAGGMVANMPVVAGVGLGLLIKGVTMYILDLQARVRYDRQQNNLARYLPSLQLSPSAYDPVQGQTLRIGLVWSGRF